MDDAPGQVEERPPRRGSDRTRLAVVGAVLVAVVAGFGLGVWVAGDDDDPGAAVAVGAEDPSATDGSGPTTASGVTETTVPPTGTPVADTVPPVVDTTAVVPVEPGPAASTEPPPTEPPPTELLPSEPPPTEPPPSEPPAGEPYPGIPTASTSDPATVVPEPVAFALAVGPREEVCGHPYASNWGSPCHVVTATWHGVDVDDVLYNLVPTVDFLTFDSASATLPIGPANYPREGTAYLATFAARPGQELCVGLSGMRSLPTGHIVDQGSRVQACATIP